MHGGTVEARSEGIGRGSSFIVRLSAKAEGEIHPPAEATRAIATSHAQGLKILVADDNMDSATSLRMLLEIMGNEVVVAHDGVEAVQIAESFDPDILILDIGMPKMNGYEACRRIRQMPGGASRVLVACTGWGQEDDRRLATEAGFDHHLVKPAELTALARILAASRASRAGDDDPRSHEFN